MEQRQPNGTRDTRTPAVAALAALLAATAAGCAGGGAAADGRPGGDPAKVVRRAADVLTRAGSSRIRTAMEMTSGGTRVTVHGTGGFDYRGRRGRVRIVLPRLPHRPITELLAQGALYMKNRGAGVPAGKWLRLDTDRLTDGNLVTNGATDPLVAAELLRGTRSVEYAGTERVDGVRVRHYRGVTDLARAARAASPYARGPLTAAAKGFADDEVTYDAYVDERGRLRRVRHHFAFAEHRDADVVSTSEMYDFGSPVRVKLPRAGDIFAGKVAPPARQGRQDGQGPAGQ